MTPRFPSPVPAMKQLLAALSICLFALPIRAAEPFELKDGDRVVWLGNTLIEREQRYGYWETALTARWPDRKIRFRNLGWSGDTVYGDARVAFDLDKPGIGLKRMVELTLAEKPTVIFICYGTNESFEGDAGMEKFKKGYEKLLDELKPAAARVVLITPIPFEPRPKMNALATNMNKHLAAYRDVIDDVAKRKSLVLADLFSRISKRENESALTDNGLHLTAYGYWTMQRELLAALNLDGVPPPEISLEEGRVKATEADAVIVDGGRVALDVRLAHLPRILAPRNDDPLERFSLRWPANPRLRARGLPEGKYLLRIDGHTEPIPTLARELAKGVNLRLEADLDQVEQLRQAIVAKNQLYFYRWRPQNETYLFGFRKHEQGQNAKEVPEFDPLVEKREAEIAKLRVPTPHTYELMPVK